MARVASIARRNCEGLAGSALLPALSSSGKLPFWSSVRWSIAPNTGHAGSVSVHGGAFYLWITP